MANSFLTPGGVGRLELGSFATGRLIQSAAVSSHAVGDYATATWAAGTYSELLLKVRQTARSTTGGIDSIKLVGLTGTYKSTIVQADPAGFGSANAIATVSSTKWQISLANGL